MHSEFYFEQAIERSLTTDGGYVKGDPKDYDQKKIDLFHFARETNPSQ